MKPTWLIRLCKYPPHALLVTVSVFLPSPPTFLFPLPPSSSSLLPLSSFCSTHHPSSTSIAQHWLPSSPHITNNAAPITSIPHSDTQFLSIAFNPGRNSYPSTNGSATQPPSASHHRLLERLSHRRRYRSTYERTRTATRCSDMASARLEATLLRFEGHLDLSERRSESVPWRSYRYHLQRLRMDDRQRHPHGLHHIRLHPLLRRLRPNHIGQRLSSSPTFSPPYSHCRT